jgi:hypothetical protein
LLWFDEGVTLADGTIGRRGFRGRPSIVRQAV